MLESPLWKWITVGASFAALASAVVALGRTVAGASFWPAIYQSAGWLGAFCFGSMAVWTVCIAWKRRTFIRGVIAGVYIACTWYAASEVQKSEQRVIGAALGVVVVGFLIWASVYLVIQKYKKTRKTCPDCCEAVRTEANICKHCGYRFSPTPAELAVDV
jgi:predicted membrane-bound spermidine synthase